MKAIAEYLHRHPEKAQFGKSACPQVLTPYYPRPRMERRVVGRIAVLPGQQSVDVQKVFHGKSASAARISASDTCLPDDDALNGSPDTGWFLRTILSGFAAPSPSAALRRYAETDDFAARAFARI